MMVIAPLTATVAVTFVLKINNTFIQYLINYSVFTINFAYAFIRIHSTLCMFNIYI